MILTLFVLIIFYMFFRNIIDNFLEGFYLLHKKKRFIKAFLHEIKYLMKDYKDKETYLIFNFENKKRTSLLFDKLTIFGKTYPIEPNKSLRIKINKKNLIKSDFIDKVTLSNSIASKSFLISINLRQENYYQTFFDFSKETTNSTEIVFYSKNNKIPNNLLAGNTSIKNYEANIIPRIKRFYVININVNDVKMMYNNYASNKLENGKALQTDLFINLIKDNSSSVIGRIFEQKIEEQIKDFTPVEIDFLKEFERKILNKELFPFFKTINKNTSQIKEENIIRIYRAFLSEKFNNIAKSNIMEKLYKTCFFLKYSDKEPTNEEINIIENAIFLDFIENNSIHKAYKFITEKNKVFNNPLEFSLKEKLFILLNIYLNIYKNNKVKLKKLYDLPKKSSYVQSEILYRDIIMNLTYDSSLYFLYLQLNSNWDFDMISSNSWFKIKKISLIEIQNHLLSDFSPFFFTFNDKSPIAFTNPKTLLKSYNENERIGYICYGNLENSENINNTVKLFFVKIHEGAHCKFKDGFNMKNSGRYLLNYDLKVIDYHLDLIRYDAAKEKAKFGANIGEEGYGAEIYILGNYKTINKLLLSKKNLESLTNIKLYTGSNFNDLKELILTKISNEDSMTLNENFDISKDIIKKKDDEYKNINKKYDLMDIFYDSLDIGIY